MDWRALTGALPLSSSGPIQPESAVFSKERGEEPGFALSFLYKCPPGDPTVRQGLRTTRKAPCNFKVLILTLKLLGFFQQYCVFLPSPTVPKSLPCLSGWGCGGELVLGWLGI